MFSRIYLGTLFSVAVIALLVYGIYEPTNQRRLQAHQHQAMGGAVDLISINLNQQEESQQLIYLELVAQLIGAELITAEDMPVLSEEQQKELARSSAVLMHPERTHMQWWFSLKSGDLAALEISALGEQQYRGYMAILVAELSKQNWPTDPDEIARYSYYPLSILAIESLALNSQQKSRLLRGHVVLNYDKGIKGGFSLYAATSNGNALKIGPVERFDPFPWSLVLLILFCSLLAIFFVVSSLVYLLQRRFQIVIDGVDLFAKGHLGKRIMLPGNDVLAKLANRIDAMAEQIESLLTGQRNLLQAVSHEVRTPLAKMRFRLQLLEEEYPSQDIADKTDALRADISQLEQLVEEILTHHRLDNATAPNSKTVDIGKIADAEAKTCQQINPDINLHSEISEGIELFADPSAIQRLISNLLTNAAKHANHEIHILVRSVQSGTEIRVEDDGAGVPESQREKVFEAFYRVDSSRNKHTGGYGLGLAIAKRICDLHGALISIQESKGLGGACFIVLFKSEPQL